MAESTQRLSFIEKAGYSLGDAAANFVFMTMILFQLELLHRHDGHRRRRRPARCCSSDVSGTRSSIPMMGVLADRTNTRWGKFRPWVLWTAVPWAVVMVLAYTVPSSESTGKLLWACVTNIAAHDAVLREQHAVFGDERRDDRRAPTSARVFRRIGSSPR